jgi:tartrate dehydrogenase/decarboxylase/D-malate dehydrogenase
MMLEHLGHKAAHDAILQAIETVTGAGPRTPDMGGNAPTHDVASAIAQVIAHG